MAANEIIQTEAEVADRELELVESENGLVSANSDLVNLLDVEGIFRIEPSEALTVEKVQPDPGKSIEIALQNRRDYLKALHTRETAKIDLRVAEDGLLWDLTLDANMVRDSSRPGQKNDYRMGLQLDIPLWRRPLKFSVLRAQNAELNASLSYLAALTELDRVLGTTLGRWGIEVERAE